jgi:ABC-type glycerol-3-phosphate transport system substrate-binding protein
MVAGPKNIGAQSSGGQAGFTKDLLEGNICAFLTPDWRITYLKQYSPPLTGKMRMMPLPVFEPTDSPTSTWGGTMVGITRGSKNKELAWELVKYLQFSPEALAARRKATDILPPIKSVWGEAQYHQPDPYFGGQRSQEMFVELAPKIPLRYVTPASSMASAELGVVLSLAVEHVRENGSDGLEPYCQVWLDRSAKDLQARIDHWKFP